MKETFLFALVLVLGGCAAPPPAPDHTCKLYQPPRGWCAYTDRE